ncbi:cyp6, partial [Symbiodinium sp. KB8]
MSGGMRLAAQQAAAAKSVAGAAPLAPVGGAQRISFGGTSVPFFSGPRGDEMAEPPPKKAKAVKSDSGSKRRRDCKTINAKSWGDMTARGLALNFYTRDSFSRSSCKPHSHSQLSEEFVLQDLISASGDSLLKSGDWATATKLAAFTEEQVWGTVWIYWQIRKTDPVAVKDKETYKSQLMNLYQERGNPGLGLNGPMLQLLTQIQFEGQDAFVLVKEDQVHYLHNGVNEVEVPGLQPNQSYTLRVDVSSGRTYVHNQSGSGGGGPTRLNRPAESRIYCDTLLPPVICLETTPMELFQKPMVEALISSMRENAAKLKANLGGPERSHEATSKQPPPSSPAGQFLQRGTAFSPALRGMPGGSSKL